MNELELFQMRTRVLLGDALVDRLAASHVLVLGVGGVGGAAAEMIARYGVGKMTLVDGDNVDQTNRNRQLPALISTVGRPKVEVVAERLRDINPAIDVICRNEFIRDEAIADLLATPYDCAVDAIDSLSPKAHFIAGCVERGVSLISSMGSGGRRNPGLVGLTDISKTHDCALARAVRQKLHRMGIRKGVRVVFSSEQVPVEAVRPSADADGNFRSMVGTVSYMPAVFGCHAAAGVLDELTKALMQENAK